MACIINASTAAGLIQTADTSGQIQLQWNGQAAPAINVFLSGADQSITAGVTTKVRLDSEIFDTNSNFDTTNNRFTPTVAGYYQVSGSILHSSNGTRPTVASTTIYVNGSAGPSSTLNIATINSVVATVTVTRIIYLNGTDYVELYGLQTGGTSNIFSAGANITYFSACLLRGA